MAAVRVIELYRRLFVKLHKYACKAVYGPNKADFIHKLKISIKEACINKDCDEPIKFQKIMSYA